MAYDLVIRGGRLVLPDGVVEAQIAVDDGRIARIADTELNGRVTLEIPGRWVLPGAVDLHVHFSEPGRTHWEGWSAGSRAAAAGGVSTVVEMPLNAIPATVNPPAFAEKLRAAQASSLVDFALWGGLVDNNLADLPDLLKTGVMGIKAFMVDTKDDSFRWVPEPILRQGMEIIAGSGLFLAVHAEDNERTWARTEALQNAGRRDRRAWNEARSVEGELEAIQRAVALAAETRCPLHVVHVSVPEGVDLLQNARNAGQSVTWETCLHYLTLTDEDFYTRGPELKCAPPLRDRARQNGLWEQLLSGSIDCVTSDHSPCPTEDKEKGRDDVWKAWGGITGIQSFLPLLVSEGIHARGMGWTDLARLTAETPARLAGQGHRKGRLQEGFDADFAVIDPGRRWVLRADDLWSRHPHSAFVGREFQGFVEQTFVRGQRVQFQGQPQKSAGGVFLPR